MNEARPVAAPGTSAADADPPDCDARVVPCWGDHGVRVDDVEVFCTTSLRLYMHGCA
jgi:hypothetical protein